MIKAVDIKAELSGRPVLGARGKDTPEAEAREAFAVLAPFRDGSIFAGSFSGESPWERHQKGDELVQILEGATAVDESMLTGESMPVEKSVGAELFAGTLNQSGRVLMRVTSIGESTALAQIIAAVQRAQSSRANIQRLGDRVSSVFVPVVVLVALAAALWWGLWPEQARHVYDALAPPWWHSHPPPGALAGAVFVASAVLIIACPCAMGLATPAAIMAGSNAAATRGILIRDVSKAPMLGEYVRISVGAPEENDKLIDALKEIFSYVSSG